MSTLLKTDCQILVVDDDKILLNALQDELNDVFSDVTTATRGANALEMMKVQQFDCIVTDYDMPEMNGLELIHQINALYPSLPTILLTGNGSSPEVLNAIETGIFDYVDKPFRAPVLINRIRNSLLMPKIERLILELTRLEFPDLKISKFMTLSYRERLRAIDALEGTILTRLLNKSKKASA